MSLMPMGSGEDCNGEGRPDTGNEKSKPGKAARKFGESLDIRRVSEG